MATTIKKYTKKDGSAAYMFKKYLGVDPLTGKQKETTRRGFSSLKEAKLALSRLEVEISEGAFVKAAKNRTYQEVFEDWFELVYRNKVKESTLWNTNLVFEKHILPVLGSLTISKISVTACQKQANRWAKENPNRYQRYVNYAGMVFKYAVAIEEIKSDPMAKISMPSFIASDEEQIENFYSRTELLYFLDEMKNKYPFKRYAFFLLLAFTGLRKGEALSLTWRDIDFKNKTLTINKTLAVGKDNRILIQKPKTQASNRTISLDTLTVDVLREWRSIQSEELDLLKIIPSVNQLIFPKADNTIMFPRTPLAWLDSFYNKHKTMQRITVHGFRHTHASLLFDSGVSMKQVQSRLGHSNIKTTMNIYTHVTQEAKEETALIFADYMKNGKNLGQSLGQIKNPTN